MRLQRHGCSAEQAKTCFIQKHMHVLTPQAWDACMACIIGRGMEIVIFSGIPTFPELHAGVKTFATRSVTVG
jgi:hypothetical protein